jgi:hypothetical protein
MGWIAGCLMAIFKYDYKNTILRERSMKLGKPWKILLGLLTAWVTLYPFLFMVIWFGMAFSMLQGITQGSEQNAPPFFLIPFFCIFPIHLATIFLMLGMSGLYLYLVIRNHAGSEIIRTILGLGVFYIPFFAMPLYYAIYIWPERPPAWALQDRRDKTELD